MNVADKIDKVNSSRLLLAVNRLVLPVAGVMAVTIGSGCVWFASQVWEGMKDLGKGQIQVNETVSSLDKTLAVTNSQLADTIKRLDRIENSSQQGFLAPPVEHAEMEGPKNGL